MMFYNYGNTPENTNENIGLDRYVYLLFMFYMTLAFLLTKYTPHRSVRYYLPMIPYVLVFLAVKLRSMEYKKVFLKLLLFLSFFSMTYTVHMYVTDILRYKNDTAKRIEHIKEHTEDGDIILFTSDRGLEMMGYLYFSRIYFITDSIRHINRLAASFQKHSISHYYLCCEDKRIEDYLIHSIRENQDPYKVSHIYYYNDNISLLRFDRRY